MNPELAAFQKKLEQFQLEFRQLLQEYAQIRRISPRVRAESIRLLEQALIRMHRTIRQVSQEYGDDLMQGISLLKIKMM